MTRCVWLGGWGISPESQQEQLERFLPDASHVVIYPGALCIPKLLDHSEQVDRIGGYSLGAFLLLRHYQLLPAKPIMLLAPILNFKAESLLGGRVPGKRLAVLLRWLRRDPLAAVNDFYQQAGIHAHIDSLPYPAEDLIWGIEQLKGPSADYWRWQNVSALIGEHDALLDSAQMQQAWPELTILPNVGHDLSEILKEAAA